MAVAKKRFPKTGPKSVAGRIKRPGRLTAMVGGPPGEHMEDVRRIASTAKSPKDRMAANYFLNILSKRGKGKKKGGPPPYRGKR